MCNRIVVATDNNIFVYSLTDGKLITTIETAYNQKGILAISYGRNSQIIACPDTVVGFTRIEFLSKITLTFTDKNNNFYVDLKKTNVFKTNEDAIGFLSLNYEGSLVAASSIKGNTILIYSTTTKQKLQELRRGGKVAEIHQILFHRSSKFLACTSNLEAVHIFELFESIKAIDETEYKEYMKNSPQDEIGYENDSITLGPNVKNSTAKLSILGSIFSKSYFASHWSLAKVKLKDQMKYCAFADNNKFIGK